MPRGSAWAGIRKRSHFRKFLGFERGRCFPPRSTQYGPAISQAIWNLLTLRTQGIDMAASDQRVEVHNHINPPAFSRDDLFSILSTQTGDLCKALRRRLRIGARSAGEAASKRDLTVIRETFATRCDGYLGALVKPLLPARVRASVGKAPSCLMTYTKGRFRQFPRTPRS